MTPRWQSGQPWARLALALLPAFVLAVLLTNGSVPIAIRLEAALVLIITLVWPAIGLMIVAFLAPLGDIVVPIFGGPPLRHAETLTVAFLAGWLLFRIDHDEPRPVLPANLTNAMWVFSGVLIASVTATALQLHKENPAALQSALATLTQSYLLNVDDPIGIHAAGRLLEGLGLIAAAAQIGQRETRDRLRLLACLVASGVVASIASGLLAIGVAPAQTLARHAAVGLARYSAVIGDVNAAASSYLLLAGVSLGLATCWRRTRPMWLAATVILLAALMLTGSGLALIAIAVVVSAAVTLWITSAAPRRWKIVGALALVLVVGGAIVFGRTARSASSLEMRGGFITASMRLAQEQPVFGIGAGRYYPLSRLVLPPRLSLAYGLENAHDYYLQIAVELGIVGVAAFVWVLAGSLSAQLKRVWSGTAQSVIVGCIGGAAAYLVTALAGHPFLIPETAIPFWIVLGLVVVPGLVPAFQSRWRGPAAIAFACALVLSVPLRGAVQVRLPAEGYGLGAWLTDESGRPFREAEAAASLFVDPAVTSVEIPIRVRGSLPAGSVLVTVTVPRSFGVEHFAGADWTTQLVRLPGGEALEPGQRINLAVSLIGPAAKEHPTPSVDVGQIRIVGRK